MSSVVVTPTIGTKYTWATSPFTWASGYAVKTWVVGAPVSYSAAIAEDGVLFSDAGVRSVSRVFNETLHAAEGLARNLILSIIESLGVAETYVDHIAFMLRAYENIGVSEVAGRVTQLPLAETIGVSEQTGRFMQKAITEVVGFSELFGRVVDYLRSINEGLGVSEATHKASSLCKNEAIGVFDEYIRRSNAVISDMIADVGDLTLTDIALMVTDGHAPGFSDFKDFITGDYDFQRAMFRVAMASTSLDTARLTELRVEVDVPDVIDRGYGVITDASGGLSVTFARQFHIVPDITLTLKGGTVVAIPDVLSSSATGFTAILKDPTTGVRVVGTFTWAAHGY